MVMSRKTIPVFWPVLADPQPGCTYSIPPVYKPSDGACVLADKVMMAFLPLPTVHSAAIACGARTALLLDGDHDWENTVFTVLSMKDVEELMLGK